MAFIKTLDFYNVLISALIMVNYFYLEEQYFKALKIV